MTIVITALASIASASLAVIFTHIFTVQRKRTDELIELKLKAYSDFLLAISHLVSARRAGKVEDELDELAKLNDAKTRICLFAEPKVVKAMCVFWERGGTLELEPEIVAFTELCHEIRATLGYKKYDLLVNDIKLSDVLFKLEPSRYSFKGRADSLSSG